MEFKAAENSFDFDDIGKYFSALSRKQINELLWSKLPIDYTDEQKLSKIGNLLTKMRKHGIIWVEIGCGI